MIRWILVLVLLAVAAIEAQIYTQGSKTGDINYYVNVAYSLLFFIGAITAFVKYSKINENKDLKKSALFFAIGNSFYGIGLLIWSYYNIFLKVEMPYPSWADASFLIFYPGTIAGIIFLIKAVGEKMTKRMLWEGLTVFLIFFGILYQFIYQNSAGIGFFDPTNMLNFVYLMADSMLTAAALIVLRTEEGISKHPYILYFVFGFIMLATADTIFSYSSAIGTYWNGDISDILFALSGFLTAFGFSYLPED